MGSYGLRNVSLFHGSRKFLSALIVRKKSVLGNGGSELRSKMTEEPGCSPHQ